MTFAGEQTRGETRLIPPELQRSTPRDVMLTAGGKAVVVFAVVLVAGAIGLGVWLSAKATRDADRLQQMRTESASATGEVIELGRTRGEDPRRLVTYRYAVGAESYTGHARFRLRGAPVLQIGSRVEVGYWPSHPEVSWLRGREPGGVPVWVGLVAPLGPMLAALALSLQFRRQRWLLAEGRPAVARVTTIKRVQHQHGHNYRVAIEFRDLSGALRTGRFEQQRKPAAVGDEVVILYDPEEPKRLAQYPMSLVRIRSPF